MSGSDEPVSHSLRCSSSHQTPDWCPEVFQGELGISCIQGPPCFVCCSSSAAAEPHGRGASTELGDRAPSPPALNPAASSQPGPRGREQPGQGRPRSLSGADGSDVGRTEAAQRVLPFMHAQRDSRRLRLRRRCRWGERWPCISHGFSELSPRGQATQED